MIYKYQNGDTIQGNKYRQEGIQAQQYQEAEAARRHAEWLARQEMRPVVVKKATRAEKIKGKKDVVKQVPQVVGMSGADPIGEFIVGTIGLNGVGALAKTGLWNVAKYAPKTWLGNYGRKYFVGKAFKDSFTGTVPVLTQVAPKNIVKTEPTKQKRVISEGTYPLYRGKQHSVKEVVNPDGTVNPRQAMRIQHEVSEQFPGSYKMEHRLENPEWHKNDPTTYHHTKNVAQSAWGLDIPYGFTKHDQMVAALGHDFGKIVAGDGHAQIGADLAKQVFPDLTEAQYKAIAEHMGTPITSLGKATKTADMRNGIVVRDINGKTRIQLPTHTDAKPREIVMDPQGNNKYYVHMRVWDDVGKHVPGNISNVEKSNLFQTLYETLPDNAEILFPKSGPGNYGTRGTVAGLQRLSRDPRFRPGSPGTLQYKGKNNEVLTYQGTSFIKKPSSEGLTKKSADYEIPDELLADWAEQFERDMAASTIAADQLPGMLGRNYKAIAQGTHAKLFKGPYRETNVAGENIIPIGTLDRSKYAAYRAARMRKQLAQRGYNINDYNYYTMNGDRVGGSTGVAIERLTSQPSTIYVTKEPTNIAGFQVRQTGKPYVKVNGETDGWGIRSVDVHEGVSHTTDELLKDVTKGGIEKEYGELSEAVGKAGFKSQADSHHWYELRATLMQMHKKLMDAMRAKNDVPYAKLEGQLDQSVDKMPYNQFADILSKVNGYGKDYADYLMQNPQSIKKFKELLKNGLVYGAPVGLTGYGITSQKKGGKTHKPFGHRSILDNGWQSTKQLKNKKNVYGK